MAVKVEHFCYLPTKDFIVYKNLYSHPPWKPLPKSPPQGKDTHERKYREARAEYKKGAESDVVVLTADMQRVLVLPKLDTKEHLFVSRLVTFNETFASKTKGNS